MAFQAWRKSLVSGTYARRTATVRTSGRSPGRWRDRAHVPHHGTVRASSRAARDRSYWFISFSAAEEQASLTRLIRE